MNIVQSFRGNIEYYIDQSIIIPDQKIRKLPEGFKIDSYYYSILPSPNYYYLSTQNIKIPLPQALFDDQNFSNSVKMLVTPSFRTVYRENTGFSENECCPVIFKSEEINDQIYRFLDDRSYDNYIGAINEFLDRNGIKHINPVWFNYYYDKQLSDDLKFLLEHLYIKPKIDISTPEDIHINYYDFFYNRVKIIENIKTHEKFKNKYAVELNEIIRVDTRISSNKNFNKLDQTLNRIQNLGHDATLEQVNRIIREDIGAASFDFFKNSPHQYLKLIDKYREENLPPNISDWTGNHVEHLSDKFIINSIIPEYYVSREMVDREDLLIAMRKFIRLFNSDVPNIFMLNKKSFFAKFCQNEDPVMFEPYTESEEIILLFKHNNGNKTCLNLEDLYTTIWGSRTNDDPALAQFSFAIQSIELPDGSTLPEYNISVDEMVNILNTINLSNGNITGMNIPDGFVTNFRQLVNIYVEQTDENLAALKRIHEWLQRSEDNKEMLRVLFVKQFNAAMYMRQWKGPGYDYPIQKDRTGHELNPETVIGYELEKNVATNLLEWMEYLGNFPIDIKNDLLSLNLYYRGSVDEIYYNYNGYTLKQSYHSLIITEESYEVLGRDPNVEVIVPFCFRMMSGPWATTALYYLDKFLSVGINDSVDINTVIDSIY